MARDQKKGAWSMWNLRSAETPEDQARILQDRRESTAAAAQEVSRELDDEVRSQAVR